jgi:hemoglobin
MEATANPKTSLYKRIGEDKGVRALVKAFYDIIETEEYARDLNLLHLRGHGVAHSRIEQFDYLSGFLGGPAYYLQNHGHTRLKEIHEHVPIDREMRDLWLKCMAQAVDVARLSPALADELMRHLTRAAESARNMD